MVSIDIRLKAQETQALRSLVGTELVSVCHDPFIYVNASSQIVQLNTDSATYYLYSFTEPLDYYGSQEDVAVWSFESERYKAVDRKTFIETPIREIVRKIYMVQENQRLYKDGKQIYDVWLTRGIIMDFGENQLSFEKAVWFSEDIYIQKGYELINRFSPVDAFIDSDWDEGIDAQCTREIVLLS